MAIPEEAANRFELARVVGEKRVALLEVEDLEGKPRYLICAVTWSGAPGKSDSKIFPLGEIFVGDVMDLFKVPDGATLAGEREDEAKPG